MMVQSSANCNARPSVLASMSLMKIMNSSGESTLPCGKPTVTGLLSDLNPFTFRVIVLSLRKLDSRPNTGPPIPISVSQSNQLSHLLLLFLVHPFIYHTHSRKKVLMLYPWVNI